MSIDFAVRGDVDDAELSRIHARAFGESGAIAPWSERLDRHSLLWVTARQDHRLVGFVNVIGDGGEHAVLLDTVVDPRRQGHGIGRRLVAVAAEAARTVGCRWLHVDYENDIADFYERVCGFHPTAAGTTLRRRARTPPRDAAGRTSSRSRVGARFVTTAGW